MTPQESNSLLLGADPYKHQPNSEWKKQQHKNDQGLLCKNLSMSPEQVFAATARYAGHEDILFRFLSALRFFEQATNRELTKEATTLRIAVAIFTIEGIAPEAMPNQERLRSFLSNYLHREDKVTLLAGFSFSEATALGEASRTLRHLMFSLVEKDTEFRKVYGCPDPLEECPTCYCLPWLQEKKDGVVNKLIRKLGGRLYAMRCSVVHDANRVYFGEVEKPRDVPLWSSTILDVFTERTRRYVTYESRLVTTEIVDIFLRGLRNCFEAGPWLRHEDADGPSPAESGGTLQ